METVPLSREIDYLNNYIELQKLRSAATVMVNFKVSGNVEEVSIAPLLLLPFVENAFKYGISSREESPVNISLEIGHQRLVFKVKNRKLSDSEKYSTGIGVPNVQRRLALLYAGKHNLEIDDKDDFYSVTLTINLR